MYYDVIIYNITVALKYSEPNFLVRKLRPKEGQITNPRSGNYWAPSGQASFLELGSIALCCCLPGYHAFKTSSHFLTLIPCAALPTSLFIPLCRWCTVHRWRPPQLKAEGVGLGRKLRVSHS